MAQEVIIRKAELSDMRRIFELSNDSVVRANSIHSEPIEWETHEKWFKDAIRDSLHKFFVVTTVAGDFVGVVRFRKEGGIWVVTIHLCERYRGLGLSAVALRLAMSRTRIKKYAAYVKPFNTPSQRLFESLGFTQVGRAALHIGSLNVELLKFEYFRPNG